MAEPFCFRDAWRRLGTPGPFAGNTTQISEEEWLWHVVQHARGVRHPLDTGYEHIIYTFDPVGLAFRVISLKDDYTPLTESEAQQYEKLLVDTLHGDVESVKADFDKVRALRAPALDPLQTVATIAAKKGHTDIVRYALEKGAVFDRSLSKALRTWGSQFGGTKEILAANEQAVSDALDHEPVPWYRQGPRPTGHEFDDILK